MPHGREGKAHQTKYARHGSDQIRANASLGQSPGKKIANGPEQKLVYPYAKQQTNDCTEQTEQCYLPKQN